MLRQIDVSIDIGSQGQQLRCISGRPQDNLYAALLSVLGVRAIALQLESHETVSPRSTFADLPSTCRGLICATRRKVFFLGLVAPESCANATFTTREMLESRQRLLDVLEAQQAAGLIWLIVWPLAQGQQQAISTQYHTVKYFEMWMVGVGAICGAAQPDSAEIVGFYGGHGQPDTGDWELQGPDGNVEYLTCHSMLTSLVNRNGNVPPQGALAVSLFSEGCQQGAWVEQMRTFDFAPRVQFRFVVPAGFDADGLYEDGAPGVVSLRYSDPAHWQEATGSVLHPECLHHNFLYLHQTCLHWEPHYDI